MKLLLLILLSLSSLLSQELVLDNLLKEYEDSESLYKKTKKESAGFLLVYSRSDLEKMQAYSLKDVLKTVRMYTIQTNGTGVLGIIQAGAGRTSMAPIKLYIDDFEISTVVQRNAFDMYGDMDIYFVDHIEIYQGGSSIAFGNEPGSMVVRLYSKDPMRENSSSAQLGADSKGGVNLRAVDAGSIGEYNYLFYANGAKTKFDTYDRNNQELSQDGRRYQTHFKVSKKDDFVVELDGIFNKSDIFNGFGVAPTGESLVRAYGYINATKYFSNSLEISLSASQEVKEVDNSDALGIKLIDGSTTQHLQMSVYSNTYKASIKKKIVYNNHDLLIGAEYQNKSFSIGTYEGSLPNPTFGPDELNIYMIYLEELYNINKNHLISFSAKVDYYEDSFSKNSTEYAIRLGYTGILSENWHTKLFAIRRYIYPTMIQTSFAPPNYKINPDLQSSNVDMINGEIEYNNKKNRLVFGLAYKEITDAIVFDGIQKKYLNASDIKDYSRYYLRVEHYFNIDNKIIIETFKGFKEVYASPASGALIQVFNTIGKVDIYNELLYREGYSLNYGAGNVDIENGYDYTLSIAYSINRQLKLKAKGENLLDKASKTMIDPQGEVLVPAVERRGIITMEYTF